MKRIQKEIHRFVYVHFENNQTLILAFFCSFFIFGVGKPLFGQMIEGANQSEPSFPFVVNVNLSDLPSVERWKPGDPIKEIPRIYSDLNGFSVEPLHSKDPLVSAQLFYNQTNTAPYFPSQIINQDGANYTGVNPPDTVGDVGLVYYCQAVNNSSGTQYQFFNKSDGVQATPPFTLEDMGSGNCSNGYGDPIILFDPLADRWIITEFTTLSYNDLCIYISQTSDPISGGWYAYSFTCPNGFPDYPKYAVWPDGYYVTTNHGGPNTIMVFDRQAMLAGAPATYQWLTIPDLDGFGFQAVIPSDIDGTTPPPASSPNYLMRHRDDEVHNPGNNDTNNDFLEIWEFYTDWVTPANTTLIKSQDIPTAEFDSLVCGTAFVGCFPQSGSGIKLDPIREVIMWRLAYRNFGDHEALVGNFVIDVDGYDTGGIRWFELRQTAPQNWSLYQEGTHAPDDGKSRWMGSIAMDGKGNIALGYNVTGPDSFPSIAYSGRLHSDPLGTLPQCGTTGENSIIEGQIANNSFRYGDYSSMSVDPVDDCTFWFTGEYNAAQTWSTRMASFSFSSCACGLPAVTGVSATFISDTQIHIQWDAVPGAESYMVFRSSSDCPSPNWELVASDITTTTCEDLEGQAGVRLYYAVAAYDADNDCFSEPSTCIPETCSNEFSFGGLESVTSGQSQSCALELNWSPGSVACFLPLKYNIFRDSSPGFVPSLSNLIASCYEDTHFVDANVQDGQTYYYLVQAENLNDFGSGFCGGGTLDGNSVYLEGTPKGPETTLFEDDIETDTSYWYTQTAAGDLNHAWSRLDDPQNAHSQNRSFFVPDASTIQDQRLNLNFSLSVSDKNTFISFWHKWETNPTNHGGVLEYSTDGGTTWFDILAGDGNSISANPDRFVQGAYNQPSLAGSSPLQSRATWSGSSSSYSQVKVDLGDFLSMNLKFRWRFCSDNTVRAQGWWIDDVQIFTTSCDCTLTVNATTDKEIICSGDSAALNLESSLGQQGVTVLWTPADSLSYSDSFSPVATPSQTTTYSVEAYCTTGQCLDSDTITIYVSPMSEPDKGWTDWRTPNPAIPDPDNNGIVSVADFIALVNACLP